MLPLRAGLVFALALSGACSPFPTDNGEVLAAPDATRDGALGSNGPRGAALTSFAAQARVTERLAVQVVFPATADGSLDTAGAPYPALVFVQGGGVARRRYHWLAAHLATRGYVVLLPDHQFDDPVLDGGNPVLALRAMRQATAAVGTLRGAIDPGATAAVVGHSLGAVVAAEQWIAHDEFGALCLLAGWPAADDDVTSRAPSPVLSIAGGADVLSAPTRVEAGALAFAGARTFALVQGTAMSGALSHYAWTDSPDDDELVSDGPRPRDLAAVRAMALSVLDTWLDATLRGDGAARARLAARSFVGVTVRP